MDPGNSLERREGWPRPSWDRAISRVRGSLREQRGEGCLALCELHVPCVAGSPRPAGHVLTWQGCTLLKHSAGRFWVGTATVRSEKVFLSGPSRSACARAPAHALANSCDMQSTPRYSIFRYIHTGIQSVIQLLLRKSQYLNQYEKYVPSISMNSHGDSESLTESGRDGGSNA